MVILEKRVVGLSEPVLKRFVRKARQAVGLRGMANVLVTSSNVVRSLNRKFRGKNKDTDVLSFPSLLPAATIRRKAVFVGDIAISADLAAKNAARFGHSAVEEVKILTLHGILHLAGYDHERDNGRMARREARLRQALHLPAALTERVQTANQVRVTRKRPQRHATGARAI